MAFPLLSTGTPPDLSVLLDTLDPGADLVHRHLWLIGLMDWIRGDQRSASEAAARVDLLLDLLDARPDVAERLRAWWRVVLSTVDGTTLLSDYGFASHNAFVNELVQRLHRKWLPSSPETTDAGELFALAMPSPVDSQWLTALSGPTLERLTRLLSTPTQEKCPDHRPSLTYWQYTVLEAINFCTSQIRAAGFSPEIRLRMSVPARDASPFHTLGQDFEALRDAWLRGQGVDEAVLHFRTRLDACRQAASSVYTHLDANGISMNLVFRLRQLRARVLRIRTLMDCLFSTPTSTGTARLLSHLAIVGQDQRSLGALVAANSSLLAAKVAERSSETGEHYITRTTDEYRAMLRNASGGGALTAVTTALKFGVAAVGLSAFWFGFWAGMVYAVSFVLIQLLHFTLATKQPAMTAPAMAAKLKDLSAPNALGTFVDEVTHLVRSQVAAIIGNVAVVFPVTMALAWAISLVRGQPMLNAEHANQVLQSISLLGPSVLFAAFTGVLLFSSSIIAGWVENWFVLHRLDSAMRFNPRITRILGLARAQRWAHFMRQQISGLSANISLGFLLGLTPPILAFFGLDLDVRHVTLSAGQLGAACASLGLEVLRLPAFWWAVACIPAIGMCNVGVSFYLAFRVALQAHNINAKGRRPIYQAIRQRLRQAPLSFFWPAREGP